MDTPAVILLSGGLDSATTAAIARQQGFALYALSVDYGQRHRFELQAARRVAQALAAKDHVVLAIDLARFGHSALTDAIAVPKDRPPEEMAHGIPVTYVPARNTVFLSLALAYAEVVGAADIFLGVNAIDYSGYPDCRPVHDPRAADPLDQGPDHPPRRRTGRRLRSDAFLLRSRCERHELRPLRRLSIASQGIRRGGAAGPG
jgi:7-cyano-7-deazaguanine synthase in queuosine biosynthesis